MLGVWCRLNENRLGEQILENLINYYYANIAKRGCKLLEYRHLIPTPDPESFT